MRAPLLTASVACLTLIACAPQPATAPGSGTELLQPQALAPSRPIERGRISYYADAFAGRTTASGERFDPEALTMAHRALPFGTRVRVTNLENQRTVEVVVNDRGPAIRGRIADLSPAAARRLGMVVEGIVEATLEVVAPATSR